MAGRLLNERERQLRRRIRALAALAFAGAGLLAVLLLARITGTVATRGSRAPAADTFAVEDRANTRRSAADTAGAVRARDTVHPGARAVTEKPARARIALVIDDFGNSLNTPVVRDLLSLPAPVTFSVIPRHRASEQIADSAAAHGHELIVHLPMEAVPGRPHAEPDCLHTAMTAVQADSFLTAACAVPHASGLSNHQGSAATQDTALMDALAAWCSRNGWFVLDSITHPGSVLYERARAAGVPALQRDLFLDHEDDPAAIRAAFETAIARANNLDRPVIAIGHPRANTAAVLMEMIPGLARRGVRLVPLSECVGSASRIHPGG
ncbi:MAG: hypothetical protein MAG453_00394 [Calditrichaeota bacterium]|nr:hypothetical protein [Calditrichota bacterium]